MSGKLGGLSLLALVVGHFAGMLDIVALPVWVGALVERFGFTPQQAGSLATLFLLGVVLASVVLSPRFNRVNPKAVAAMGFGGASAAFFAASLQTGFVPLALLHAVAGVATGSALSMVHGTMGRTENPHRIFAISGIFLGLFAVVFYGAVPPVLQAHGGAALFWVFSGVMALAFVPVVLFFRNPARLPETGQGAQPFPRSVWLVIGGVCLMTFNQAMVFSFVEVIGSARGFAKDSVLIVLIVLGFVNFLIAAPATVLLEKRLPAFFVVQAGPVVQAVFAVIVTSAAVFPLWSAVASFFVAVQIFTHAFAFGLLGRLDRSGRALAATPAMLMLGAALGPIIGGALGQTFGFAALGVAAVIVSGAAVICFRQASVGASVQALQEQGAPV
jgi:predicted MFS family arabinose efflux permease